LKYMIVLNPRSQRPRWERICQCMHSHAGAWERVKAADA